MELPTWKGAYCPRCVNPLSVRLFNHARGGEDYLIWTSGQGAKKPPKNLRKSSKNCQKILKASMSSTGPPEST